MDDVYGALTVSQAWAGGDWGFGERPKPEVSSIQSLASLEKNQMDGEQSRVKGQ